MGDQNNWRSDLSDKELKMLNYAQEVAENYSDIPIIGYNFILLVAKLVGILNNLQPYNGEPIE